MFLLAFQPLYFPDSFARSHSASFGMIIPSAVSTTGVITFIAKVNGFLSYIPRRQLAAVSQKTPSSKKVCDLLIFHKTVFCRNPVNTFPLILLNSPLFCKLSNDVFYNKDCFIHSFYRDMLKYAMECMSARSKIRTRKSFEAESCTVCSPTDR